MITPAVDQRAFQDAVASMPADSLSVIREAAAARFAELDFPATSQEEWKYTNLAPAAAIANAALREFALDPAPGSRAEETEMRAAAVRAEIKARWLVVRNGEIDEMSLTAAVKALGNGVAVNQLSKFEAPVFDSRDDPMALFNAALLRDGLHISVAKDCVAEELLGVMIIDDGEALTSQTRITIDLAANSALRVVEYSLSADNGDRFTTTVTETSLGQGSHLDYVRIQDRDRSHLSVNKSHSTLARDATFRHNNFDFGGAMTRNSLMAEISGAGGHVDLHGLYLVSGKQHVDNHTAVVHAVGPATSTEEYRGILNGRARGVFNSKAIVSPGADGTDASQANHNLLLSDQAEIDTKPELEIYADEVKCSHGATVGQLDASALFYLRSRGLNEAEAARMLTGAFAAQVLDKLVVAECHEHLQKIIGVRLEELVNDRNE